MPKQSKRKPRAVKVPTRSGNIGRCLNITAEDDVGTLWKAGTELTGIVRDEIPHEPIAVRFLDTSDVWVGFPARVHAGTLTLITCNGFLYASLNEIEIICNLAEVVSESRARQDGFVQETEHQGETMSTQAKSKLDTKSASESPMQGQSYSEMKVGDEIALVYDNTERIRTGVITNTVYGDEVMAVMRKSDGRWAAGRVYIWDTARMHLKSRANNVVLPFDDFHLIRLHKKSLVTSKRKKTDQCANNSQSA